MWIELVLLLLVLMLVFYKWSTAKYKILEQRGVPHDKPVPLFGTIPLSLLMAKSSVYYYLIDNHVKFKSKVYGLYQMRDSVICLYDTELIKKVGIKDFDTFPNHITQLPANETDDILTKGLISLKDGKWKAMRATLSPSFTGSKMRLMHDLINECCSEGIKFLGERVQAAENGLLDLELKGYFTKFTNDVIASVAFGIKVNSYDDKLDNDFFRLGKKITDFTPLRILKVVLYGLMPKLMKMLGVEIFDKKDINYFKDLVLNSIKYREEHNIQRADMISLLMEAKKHVEESKKDENDSTSDSQMTFENEDILAQCFLFFFAGFDTVSSCLCFTAYELAMNPEVQQTLFEEIQQTHFECGGEQKMPNYDALMKMKYLDMVISESLRKWPPSLIIDRVCSKDYTLLDEQDNIVVELKKGDLCAFNIVGSHYDPANFSNPEQFDPLRFSEENKNNIRPYTYLPFGVGPRSCIANRFALMEVKTLIYHILLNFQIVANDKTPKDLKESIKGFNSKPNLFCMRFMAREN